jgi:hypothetical protein
VVLQDEVQCRLFDSTSELTSAVSRLSKEGRAPLLATQSGGRGLLIIKREHNANPVIFEEPIIPHEALSLVTLIGPGVGSASEMSASVQRKLAPFLDQVAAYHLTESRLSVLLPSDTARIFAESAHDLCLLDSAAAVD